MRLVIIDDHPIFREGVVLTLTSEADLTIVGEGESADEAVRLAGRLRPDILLLDLDIPGGGLAALQKVREVSPETRIVILTGANREMDLLVALRAGVKGYVLKGVSARQLANIARAVYSGKSYVSPELAASALSSLTEPTPTPTPTSLLDELTERERQILDLVASGASNKQIAIALNVKENTVKNHMTIIMEKLQVQNRVEAALLASRAGRLSSSS